MKGNVRLQVEGLMSERLIQRATQQGARIKVVCRLNEKSLLIDTDEAGARIIRNLCKRYGLPVRCLRRDGGGAILVYLRSRRTLLAGMLTFALLCWVFLGHIWRIDLQFTGEAAAQGDPETLRQTLNALGIHPGISIDFDTQALSDALMARMDSIGFIGARIEGVRLAIQAMP